MPFRAQPFCHVCGVCERPAESACPRCRRAICSLHRADGEGCCVNCAADLYLEASRAGRRAFTAGSVIGGISLAALYVMSQLGVLPPLALGASLIGVITSLTAVLWGGLVSPRLVRRAQLRELKHPRALPATSPRELESGYNS